METNRWDEESRRSYRGPLGMARGTLCYRSTRQPPTLLAPDPCTTPFYPPLTFSFSLVCLPVESHALAPLA